MEKPPQEAAGWTNPTVGLRDPGRSLHPVPSVLILFEARMKDDPSVVRTTSWPCLLLWMTVLCSLGKAGGSPEPATLGVLAGTGRPTQRGGLQSVR